jgi:hypothetical protein
MTKQKKLLSILKNISAKQSREFNFLVKNHRQTFNEKGHINYLGHKHLSVLWDLSDRSGRVYNLLATSPTRQRVIDNIIKLNNFNYMSFLKKAHYDSGFKFKKERGL